MFPSRILGKRKKGKKKNSQKEKVFVAISGGVDSSVSAALLKEEAYEVVGVFMKVWQPDFLPCTWRQERRDAMRACAQLEIPFETFDLKEEYKQRVVDYMIEEYKAGRTPNPDIMCNKYVKFGAFLERVKERGGDYMATGHYVFKRQRDDGRFELLMGADKEKDQSYFLWTLTQNELAYILFPVGDYQKSEVRKTAAKFELPAASKKDSQGICFLGKISIREFLSHYVSGEPGNVLDEQGNVIGEHQGAIFYTFGQRHGFDITKKDSQTPKYYIVDKNVEENTVTVSPDPTHSSLVNKDGELRLERVNWIMGTAPPEGSVFQARFRYRQPLMKCRVEEVHPELNTARVKLEGQKEPAPSGQSLVLYDGEVCLGGGIIE